MMRAKLQKKTFHIISANPPNFTSELLSAETSSSLLASPVGTNNKESWPLSSRLLWGTNSFLSSLRAENVSQNRVSSDTQWPFAETASQAQLEIWCLFGSWRFYFNF